MYGRLLSLIVFRLILATLLLVYQLVTLELDYPRMPFVSVLYALLAISVVSVIYVYYLKFHWTPVKTTNFVFVQFFIDITAISILVTVTGGVDSQLEYAYLIVILLSAIFLDRSSIYVLTILSLAFYFLSLKLVQQIIVDTDNVRMFLVTSERISKATISQFVICFLTAMLSVFMQATYLAGRKTLQAQSARLRSLRTMHKLIIETLPSGLVTCLPDGEIVFINDTGRDLLGLDERDVLGTNAWEILALRDDQRPELDSESERARIEVEVALGTRKRIIGVSYSPMPLEEGGRGFLIIFRDLTEIKMFEEQKLMQERMAAIGKMAAGVAHEIRNPLASISGSVQVLGELLPDKDDTAVELAGIVVSETQRLDKTISEFLAYARPSPPPKFEPLDLGKLVSRFVTLARNDNRLLGLTVETDVQHDGSPIFGDESQLMQVFWNLIRNSHAACHEGGRVLIACRTSEQSISLSFSDNGIGMTPEQLEDLFTPFQSFSNTGTGLGMNIVYDIIQIHRGDIRVDSEPGKGTIVTMTFARYEE